MHAFNFDTEEELQRGIAKALDLAGAPYTREMVLDARSRIDFMVHGRHEIGIEVKIAGAAVWGQIKRYLQSDMVDGVVIVTTKRQHRSLTGEHLGKWVEVVWLGFSSL